MTPASAVQKEKKQSIAERETQGRPAEKGAQVCRKQARVSAAQKEGKAARQDPVRLRAGLQNGTADEASAKMQSWEDAWLAEDAKRRDGASLFPARASDQQIADSINAFRRMVAADSPSAVCAVCGEFSTDTSVWALNRANNTSGAKLIAKALLNNLKAVLQNCLDRPIQTACCALGRQTRPAGT